MLSVKRRDKEESAADEHSRAQAMNAMADMVRTLQADRVPLKEKELMTTKRALTKLPNSCGKAEERENWVLQMNCTGKNNIFSQSKKRISYMKKKVNDVTADHSNPPLPQDKKEANETRAKYPMLGWYNQ